MVIESTKNAAVKRAKSLALRKNRLESGLHFIEGDRLVREAVISGAQIKDAFIEEGHDLMVAILEGAGASVTIVSHAVMASMTNTTEPQYVCATVVTPEYKMLTSFSSGLYVALDTVQDPGNLGTIIRTADAFGTSAILLSSGCADPFAPKTLRASMGSVYHLPIYYGADLVSQLSVMRADGFTLICGHLDGEENLPEVSGSTTVVIGNEGNGVSDDVSQLCSKYRLPMYGLAESLNASVAAGIIIYQTADKMFGGNS